MRGIVVTFQLKQDSEDHRQMSALNLLSTEVFLASFVVLNMVKHAGIYPISRKSMDLDTTSFPF
jgi:hypothetical protein